MMKGREPLVVRCHRDGFIDKCFSVDPVTNVARRSAGFYLMIPVASEKEAEETLKLLRAEEDRRFGQPHHGHESPDQP